MKTFAIVAGVALVAAGLASFAYSRDRAEPGVPVFHDVQPNGHARFYSEVDGHRQAHWTVTCRAPLRGCVARSHGLILTADRTGTLRLIGYAPPRARVSIWQANTKWDAQDLFGAPLTEAQLAQMARRPGELVVEDDQDIILRTRLDGLPAVAAYLHWLQYASARGARDASQWIPPDGTLYASSPHIAPTQQEAWPKLIPETKPQVEFAIRAQKEL